MVPTHKCLGTFSHSVSKVLTIYCIVTCSVLARTDPRDVARVEKVTYMCTPEKRQTCPETAEGVTGHLANWLSPADLQKALDDRFPSCMTGKSAQQHNLCSACALFALVNLHFVSSEPASTGITDESAKFLNPVSEGVHFISKCLFASLATGEYGPL